MDYRQSLVRFTQYGGVVRLVEYNPDLDMFTVQLQLPGGRTGTTQSYDLDAAIAYGIHRLMELNLSD